MDTDTVSNTTAAAGAALAAPFVMDPGAASHPLAVLALTLSALSLAIRLLEAIPPVLAAIQKLVVSLRRK